ncbi:YqzG/YhdC family protein [Sporosarcina sp. E16_8]|nr:DUF3889 domain-containing protein [Sporosarcina sp. E16_8]MBO0588911.1 YqzG/YhdC family protein [Sporosarcina sp. E16_8]
MRKMCMTLGVFMLVNAASIHIPTILHAKEEQPAYAKWGRLAIKETEAKYPNAKVIDYLHEGSESQKDETIEKFKLWLKEDDKEFGVFVRIKFMTKTEQVITIDLQETSR